MEDNVLLILRNQYHGFWWTGDARSQGISIHGIDLVPRNTPASGPERSLSAWWRHQMETFSALLALCAGNSPVTGEFPAQRPVTRSFDDFFDLSLNRRLSKQPRRRWFETPYRPLWRHCNVIMHTEPQDRRLTFAKRHQCNTLRLDGRDNLTAWRVITTN